MTSITNTKSLSDRDSERVDALISEGLGILNNLRDSIAKHGNYSAESTMGFVDQAGACLREALAESEKSTLARGDEQWSEKYLKAAGGCPALPINRLPAFRRIKS